MIIKHHILKRHLPEFPSSDLFLPRPLPGPPAGDPWEPALDGRRGNCIIVIISSMFIIIIIILTLIILY